MKIVFCNSLLAPNKPDEDFAAEYESAKQAGLDTYLVSLEQLREGDVARALRRIPIQAHEEKAIYRGWMLQADEYQILYQGLQQQKLHLINSPKQYLNCHYFPNSYHKIEAYTPSSIYFEVRGEVDFQDIVDKLTIFEGKPVIVKDYVKSEKHYWEQACFIPSSTRLTDVERVTSQFLNLRGNYLNQGLVYREFVELEPLTIHSKSGMPLTKEFRLFYLNGKLLTYAQYWNEGDYEGEQPDVDKFNQVATQIESNFFTMDIAKQKNASWLIMELGDGQVSGFPEPMNVDDFYVKIKE
jgi:hypothetical protein